VRPQAALQVEPAAQSCAFMPLHSIWQAAVPPQATLHPAEPPHSAVHPPLGQSIMQVLSPAQVMVEPGSSVTLQALPPAQVTLLFTPVVSVHSLLPAQLEVQFDVQLPAQTERPSHVFEQPLPQVRSHWLFESQW
jgi:hypothetical protein